MSTPPQYADVGKNARDLFSRGFYVGVMKFDLRSKTESGVEFNTSGTSDQGTGLVAGHVEAKYKFPKYGITQTEKWSTDNVLSTNISVQDQLCHGLKLDLNCTLTPSTGKSSSVIKSSYTHERMHFNCMLDMSKSSPIFTAANVISYNSFLAGVQSRFDVMKRKVLGNSFLLAYQGKDFTIVTNVNDGQEYKAAIYQKVNPQMDLGIMADWTAASNNTRLSVAAKYMCDNDSVLRGKINNANVITLSYQMRIRKGIVLTFGLNIDSKSFESGGHKVGVGIELEP